MQVHVKEGACVGHGRCNFTAPELYELDDDGYVAIDGQEVPSSLEEPARHGAASCPERAITLD